MDLGQDSMSNMTLACCFCEDEVSVNDVKMKTFKKHFAIDHDIIHNMKTIIALSFMNKIEMKELNELMESRIENFLKTGNNNRNGNVFDLIRIQKGNCGALPMKEHNPIKNERNYNAVAPEEDDKTEKEFLPMEDQENEELNAIKILIDRKVKQENTTVNIAHLEVKKLFYDDGFDNIDGDSSRKEGLTNLNYFVESNNEEAATENVNHDEQMETDENILEQELEQEDVSSNTINGNLLLNICKLCYKSFSEMSTLESHIATTHQNDKDVLNRPLRVEDLIYDCSLCPLKFLTQGILDRHKGHEHKPLLSLKISQKTALTNAGIECKLCYRQFSNNSGLQQHTKIHKEDQEYFEKELSKADQKFECPDGGCNLIFVSENVVKYHYNNIHREEEAKQLRNVTFSSEEDKYVCPLCYTKYEKFRGIMKHVSAYHSEDYTILKNPIKERELLHSCNKCEKRFLKERYLVFHQERKHGVAEKIQNCNICNKEVHKYRLKEHMSRHSVERKFTCKLCYLKFKTKRYVYKHIKKVHQSEKKYISLEISEEDLKFDCQTCELKFLNEKLLNGHSRSHGTQSILKKKMKKTDKLTCYCQLCNILFKKTSMFKLHRYRLHLICKDEMEALERVISPEELTHGCTECDLNFLTKNILDYHMKNKHNLKAVCILCYISYKDIRNYNKHIQTFHVNAEEQAAIEIKHIDENKLIYECNRCQKRFLTESILNYHLSRKHHEKLQIRTDTDGSLKLKISTDTNNRYCQLCNVTFKKSSMLPVHRKNIHLKHQGEMEALGRLIKKEELAHHCNSCDSYFLTENILSYHRRKKHNFKHKKPLTTCILCNRPYSEQRTYEKHISTQHISQEEKTALKVGYVDERNLNFKCDHCDERFLNQSILTFHTRYRHKETINSYCKLCYITFKHPSGLKKHKHVVHKMDIELFDAELMESHLKYPCGHCGKIFASEQLHKYHIRYSHKLSTDSKCKWCYLTFKHPSGLKKHKYIVHRMDTYSFDADVLDFHLKFPCDRCGKKFVSEVLRKYHLKNSHMLTTETICKWCNFTFKLPSDLKSHKENIHKSDSHAFDADINESQLQYTCEQCNLKFVSEKFLNYHTRYGHKDLLPREPTCRLCQVNFKDAHLQRAHVKRCHTTPEELDALKNFCENIPLDYNCKFCELKFFTCRILVNHTNNKHKDEDWNCELCSQVYPKQKDRTSKMKLHMKNKHGFSDTNLQDQKQVDMFKNFSYFISVLNGD